MTMKLVIVVALGSWALAGGPAAAQEIAPGAAAPPTVQPSLPQPDSAYVARPGYEPPHGNSYAEGNSRYRSPGIAVVLSLQPLPVDFGNLYAENFGWGIAYTAIEVSLLAPMMWMTGAHMGGHGNGNDARWSGSESGAMVGLLSGYVLVKIVSGLHAGYAAKAFNQAYEPRAMAFVAPARGGALLAWSGWF